MTPIMNSRPKRVLQRTDFRLLTFVCMAIAAGSAGCTNARPGVEPLSSDAKPDSSSSSTWLSTEELQVLGRHISPTIFAEFTADGKWIVVAGTDGVTIHNAFSTQRVRWFNGKLVEASPDGASFLLKHPSGPVELRSIPDGGLVWRLPSEVATSELHFTDDGQYIVCGYCNLLRIETREVAYRSPDTYYFDRIDGGDRYGNPADRPPQDGEDDVELAAKRSALPYIYRTTLRHDARPLITPRSGLCSPAGRFMIVQTGEEDSSLEPYYSFINRKTGERLFSNVRSYQALFFHNDDYVFYEGSVYQTKDREIPYALGKGVTAFALNADETMLAVGWQNGQVAVLDPISGKESCRLTVEKHIDTRRQKSGDIVSLAFSHDSQRLAAVGRSLTLIDIPARTISGVLHLGAGSREVAEPETTSPAKIVFNTDDSRLLLTGQQGDEYVYSRARVHVLHSTDLGKRRALVSTEPFDRFGNTPPVYFNSDGAWAIVPEQVRRLQADRLQLWDTDARQPIAEISPVMHQWHYRRRFVVPDFPKRHLGLGHFRSWYADELVFHPWSIDAIESSQETVLPDGAKQWLETFVQVNPHNTSRYTNGRTLDLPSRQWALSFNNNRIHRLYDLSTGEIYPPDAAQPTPQQARELGAIDIPKTCWGLSALDQNERVPERQAKESSTQILVGDLETGQQIQCSAANWSQSPLQHKLFTPDGAHLITISSDKMVCWKLHPLEQAWETSLSDCWTDPETGTPFSRAETLGWSFDYTIHPSDQSILIAADGREAILFSLATGKELQRFGPLPIHSVLRFGADGTHLQVGFRANRSMKLYGASSGELISTYHFTNEGTKLHRFASHGPEGDAAKN